MTPEREIELAKELGLERVPKPIYNDVPPPAPSIESRFRPNFWKSCQLVDRLATAAFWKYIPGFIDVDQSESADVWADGCTFAALVRTDIAPPSNKRIHNATGIKPQNHSEARERENYYRYLAVILASHARELGCYKIAPPLVFETLGDPDNPLAPPYIGVIMKFLRKAADGQRLIDQVADVGVLTRPGERVDLSKKRVPVLPPDTRASA